MKHTVYFMRLSCYFMYGLGDIRCKTGDDLRGSKECEVVGIQHELGDCCYGVIWMWTGYRMNALKDEMKKRIWKSGKDLGRIHVSLLNQIPISFNQYPCPVSP